MFSAFTHNDLLLSMRSTLAGDDVDLESARKAYQDTKGDFRAKFTAAVEARLAHLVQPEVFIDVPENVDELRKSDLEALVRPAADGFLRSNPTKGELLEQAAKIRRRQHKRPAWIPRITSDGEPIEPPATSSTASTREPDRPLTVDVLAEIGEVTVQLPAAGQDRPELPMASGGIGEWEAALFSLLGLADSDSPASTITIDAEANEALVPEDSRWWSSEPPKSVPAQEDPGVASELLATTATLGGLPVTDNTSEGYDAVVGALVSAGDWRYSPRWVLETHDPADGTAAMAVAYAAITGWADEHRSGVIVYVYGGALRTDDGLYGAPGPLHSYLLAVTRATDGTDAVDTVRRVIWSCPGDHWCRRGGCPDVDLPEIAALLTPIITAGHAAAAARDAGEEAWAESYRVLYGDDAEPEYFDRVLDQVTAVLSSAGWAELEQSTWEGGLEQSLLRRGEHCLAVAYDPVTRQVQLTDGKTELDGTLQLLADDGVLVEDDNGERIDTGEAAVESWGLDLLTAANDLLHNRINDLPQLTSPAQATVLGLHPHADGDLRGPRSVSLLEGQLGALLSTTGLLP
ncbi:hypothetical protein [Amycolatopsis nalaikhensis]|uniref:Uncharacterized protein n=1 Tax=Amycolatopsis nalaikhensis TaxID=715472 RepID=A0ABY8XEC6_9PSEU|nr:hypothetical protein [Amycolatopsis sp. 2-2]WIV53978.1 hypothetical protein QP939_34610 [Amycolatopsis sp. 2-2]